MWLKRVCENKCAHNNMKMSSFEYSCCYEFYICVQNATSQTSREVDKLKRKLT